MLEIGTNLSTTIIFASLFWAGAWAVRAYFKGK
jgi:hypothetical protein